MPVALSLSGKVALDIGASRCNGIGCVIARLLAEAGAEFLSVEFGRRHNGRPGGRIINMVSGELLGPMVNSLPYVITKGAVDAMTITLAKSLPEKGITVNAIDPGPTETGCIPPELFDELVNQAPMSRVGIPEDAGHLALFPSSALGQWITGQIIHSRGGFA